MFPAACSSVCWLMSEWWVMALLPICLRLLCFSWAALERMKEMAFSEWEWLILSGNTQWDTLQYSVCLHITGSVAFKLNVIGNSAQQQSLRHLWVKCDVFCVCLFWVFLCEHSIFVVLKGAGMFVCFASFADKYFTWSNQGKMTSIYKYFFQINRKKKPNASPPLC